jgi:RNA-directed DNA polymerase
VVSTWLQDLGLTLKPSKTRLTHTYHPCEGELGVDFLGFHIRQYPVGKYKTGKGPHNKPLGFKTLITPSKEGQRTHLLHLKEIVRKLRAASPQVLIGQLNPRIRGWSNYYAAVVAKATFARMDALLYAKLRRWARRRHPNKSARWVHNKYWHPRNGVSPFATNEGHTLRQHAATPIRRHTKATGSRSPYDGDWVYWATRMGKHPEISPRWAFLLKRQQGRCPGCGLYFRQDDDIIELDHITPSARGGDGRYGNLQLLHGHCHDKKTAQDQAVNGTCDKSQTTEEPYDGKLSRTVLKPSQEG